MDFPANTNKSKEPKQKAMPEKKIEKVVTTEVVTRKKSFGSRLKDVFIGGESKAALRYITGEVLLPAVRNMIVEATTKGIERMIYGDTAPRRPSGQPQRVTYNSPVNRGASPIYSPQRNQRPQFQARYEVADLLFGNRDEAEAVLESMYNIIETYEMVSVADLHELAGLPSTHVDNKWGWTNLQRTMVKQVREGYLIDFPPVEAF